MKKKRRRKNKSPKKVLALLAIVLLVGIPLLAYTAANKFVSDRESADVMTDAKGSFDESAQCNDVVEATVNRTSERGSSANEGTSAKKPKTGNVRLMELPATKRGEVIISHSAYTLSFNTQHNNPNWVAWELTATEVDGNGRRSNEFLPDPDIDERHRVTTDDYKGSGYDRGHMCPAADNKFEARAMTECFYMTNMCPQLHELNAGGWESLESACRRWAKTEGSVLIVCGPVYDSELKARQGEVSTRKQKTIGKEHRVTVPTGFFKCVMSLREGHEKAIGFYYTNDDKKQPMNEVCMTVDDIEAMTGYDFFVNVPDKLEKRIEAQCKLADWR